MSALRGAREPFRRGDHYQPDDGERSTIVGAICDVLGRDATSPELSRYGRALHSGTSRSELLVSLVQSREYRPRVLAGVHPMNVGNAEEFRPIDGPAGL